MKTFRVTLTYLLNNHSCIISTIIPPANRERAIDSCMVANCLGEVLEARAEELKS
jgi:hypothetical protein